MCFLDIIIPHTRPKEFAGETRMVFELHLIKEPLMM